MNTLDRRSFVLGSGALGALLPAADVAAAATVGSVATVRGTAFAERGPTNVSLVAQSPVLLNDLVRTEPDSRCAMTFGAGTTVHLGENVKLRIDRFIINAGRVLTLEAGAVLVDKSEATRSQRLLLNSPYALIAIRGTSYFAGLLPDGFGVFVERGKVAVMAAGARVLLGAGEGTRIAKPGDKPEEAKKWGAPKIALARNLIR
jgi:ferric-dicitrate binding protein FerR (iron transport regulator)